MSSNYSSLTEFVSTDVSSGITDPPPIGSNNTDLVYQQVKLYIEGVEVPFVNISISQSMGALPTCEVEIPPQTGLMDIVRYYQPKVHVFYTDLNTGGDRLLFWGQIVATSYSKSRAGTGSTGIRFRCRHRNYLAQNIILYFGGVIGNSASPTLTTNNPGQATGLMNDFNSITSITKALAGITGVQEDSKDLLGPSNKDLSQVDLTKLSKDFAKFEQRLIGMPSIIVNLWNQLKLGAYASPNTRLNLLAMYIPLFEQGLSYFKRLSGHYLLEKQQQDSKSLYCPTNGNSQEIMVPPSYRTGSMSAVSAEMAINAIKAGVGFSGEMTGFINMCENFYSSIEYEMITLASPAEVALDPTLDLGEVGSEFTAVETIVKPQIPFYYSPVCNVIFPKMFDSIFIDQDEETVPTRIMAMHSALPTGSNLTANYRGPNSIREAQSLGSVLVKAASGTLTGTSQYDLGSTTGNDFNIPGKYEQGRGISPIKTTLPWWLVLLAKEKTQDSGSSGQESFPAKGTQEYENLLLQSADWNDRYAYNCSWAEGVPVYTRNANKESLNPFSPSANIQPHERLLFSAVDYDFSKAVARSRQGTITSVFNPYIIPGYPMDVLDDTPHHPSFHGICSSVTHTITARSISTNIGITAALTYTELSNYYHPPIHPWLQSALGMVNGVKTGNPEDAQYGDASYITDIRSTILQNPEAKAKADEFYSSVLGVGSADPSTMYDFATGQVVPQSRERGVLWINASGEDSIPSANGGEDNDWLTTVGNLRLVHRLVESKDSIATKFQYMFIDMVEDNYTGTCIEYSNPAVNSAVQLEPGASMFLEYVETEEFIKAENTHLLNMSLE